MGNGLLETSFGVVQYPQSVIDDTCGSTVDRELRPGEIGDAEFGLCRPIENPDGLDEVVVLHGSGNACIAAKIIDPGAIFQQRGRIGSQETEINIRVRSGVSSCVESARGRRQDTIIALRPACNVRYEFVGAHNFRSSELLVTG